MSREVGNLQSNLNPQLMVPNAMKKLMQKAESSEGRAQVGKSLGIKREQPELNKNISLISLPSLKVNENYNNSAVSNNVKRQS